jgi:Flp pilus assembly pilin Flp
MQWSVIRFKSDESAGTAIEYAVIAACISLVLIVVLRDTALALAVTFGRLLSAVGNGWNAVPVP